MLVGLVLKSVSHFPSFYWVQQFYNKKVKQTNCFLSTLLYRGRGSITLFLVSNIFQYTIYNIFTFVFARRKWSLFYWSLLCYLLLSDLLDLGTLKVVELFFDSILHIFRRQWYHRIILCHCINWQMRFLSCKITLPLFKQVFEFFSFFRVDLWSMLGLNFICIFSYCCLVITGLYFVFLLEFLVEILQIFLDISLFFDVIFFEILHFLLVFFLDGR